MTSLWHSDLIMDGFTSRVSMYRSRFYVPGWLVQASRVFILVLGVFITWVFIWEVAPIGLSPPDHTCTVSSVPNYTKMWQSSYKVPATPLTSQTQYTVLMMTNQRPQLFRRVLKNLGQIDSIAKIVVLWTSAMPQEVLPAQVASEVVTRMPVIVREMRENRLGLRYDDLGEIETDGVLIIDDDLLVHPYDLNHAFDVWKHHPWALVGFNRRSHSGSKVGSYNYQLWIDLVLRGGYYSMILTNTAFLHKDYLLMYQQQLPEPSHHLVDKLFNCEDIAMNFVVQDHCDCAGTVYVKNRHSIDHLSDHAPKLEGHAKGISKDTNHMTERHMCLNQFASHYKKMPLRKVGCRY